MRWLDLSVILLYLIGITWFGAQFKNSQKTLKDYFLGGRNAPWWAIAFSIVSAETSTLTVIGTPALAFAGNFGFLQVVLGYLLARVVISTLFLPAYFRGELFTAYELMSRRFGPNIRRLTAGSFLVLRAMAEGVRVFAISIVISIILGESLQWMLLKVLPQSLASDTGTAEIAAIFLIVCLTLFYTFEGGMTAVIWTDVIQMFLYVAGAILSFFVILQKVDGGWGHVATVAGQLNKFQVFDFRFSFSQEFFTRTYSFWAGVIGGCFLTTASHGTEQLMVQRLLSAKSEAESRAALYTSWLVVFFQFTLFLLIGVSLFVYYSDRHLAAPAVSDRIYPEFIWNNLPHGIAGLIIAAILAAAMSNLSAALNSLASTTIMDFVKPLSRQVREEAYYLRLARYTTIGWGAVLFGIAVISRNIKYVLPTGLSIASIVYGSLLGVFLLGLLTTRVQERSAMAGMVAGLGLMLYVKFATTIAWTWYVLIGTTATVTVGYAISMLLDRKAQENIHG